MCTFFDKEFILKFQKNSAMYIIECISASQMLVISYMKKHRLIYTIYFVDIIPNMYINLIYKHWVTFSSILQPFSLDISVFVYGSYIVNECNYVNRFFFRNILYEMDTSTHTKYKECLLTNRSPFQNQPGFTKSKASAHYNLE